MKESSVAAVILIMIYIIINHQVWFDLWFLSSSVTVN